MAEIKGSWERVRPLPKINHSHRKIRMVNIERKPNIWLFGPPGIGKSTVANVMRNRGFFSLDFENLWNGNQDLGWNRNNLNRIVASLWLVGDINAVYAAAGLDPKLPYPGLKILLYLPQNMYDMRRSIRDALHPEYKNQTSADISTWYSMTNWDHVITADHSVDTVLTKILRSRTTVVGK